MIKKLEALDRLFQATKGNQDTSPFRNRSDYDIIKQALTPPTEEEVCEALSKWLNAKVVYKQKNQTFYYRQSTYNVELACYYYDKERKDYVIHFEFGEPLPLHLITMIGKFYESLDNGE